MAPLEIGAAEDENGIVHRVFIVQMKNLALCEWRAHPNRFIAPSFADFHDEDVRYEGLMVNCMRCMAEPDE